MSGKSETGDKNLDSSDNPNSDEGGLQLPNMLILFLIFAVVSLLVNAKVIHVILFKMSKLTRPIPLLVAHLATVSICLGLSSLFYTNDAVSLIHISEEFCKPMSYLRSVLFAVFFINIFFIIYERLGPSRHHHNRQLLTKWIFIMWLVPLVFSLPTVAMVKPKSEVFDETDNADKDEKLSGNCVPVPLFESFYATVFYEMLRFTLFHGAVAVYMIYALLTIRAKMKYLKDNSSTSSERLKRKVHSIRLIYFHLISFALVSLPAGLYVFFQRVLSRMKNTTYTATDQDGDIPMEDVKLYIGLAVFLYFMINPIISLFLLETNLRCSFHCFCCISIENIHCQSEYEFLELTNANKNLKDAWTQIRDVQEQGSMHTLGTSRYSTNAFTSTVQVDVEGGMVGAGTGDQDLGENKEYMETGGDRVGKCETGETVTEKKGNM